MKKYGLALLGLALLVLGTSAYAETINLKVNIPFNFVVGATRLPSGEYSIQELTTAGALAIRPAKHGPGMLLLAHSCQSVKPSDRAKVVLHRYGDRYFLAQVWMPGNTSGRELPKSRQEIEVAADYPRENVVLVASLR